MMSWLRNLFSSPYIIAIAGPEGAGKSTISELMSETIGLADGFVYLGENDTKVKFELPFVCWLKYRQNSKLYSRLFTVIMPIEMVLRYFRIRFFSKNKIIIMDRYPTIKPRKTLINLWYNTCTRICIPRPDVYILLGGDLKKIWQRKKKSEFSMFEREFNKFKTLYDIKIAKLNIFKDVTALTKEQTLESICLEIFSSDHFRRQLLKDYPRQASVCWQTLSYHYKFCLNENAIDELAVAIKKIDQLRLSENLNSFAVDYQLIDQSILQCKSYQLVPRKKLLSKLKDYFSMTAATSANEECSLSDIIENELLKQTGLDLDKLSFCEIELRKQKCLPTFAHRDFHSDNFLYDPSSDSLKLIDCADLRFESCHFFDLINLVLFEESHLANCSYFDVLEKLPSNDFITVENRYKALWDEYSHQIDSNLMAAYILDYILVDYLKMKGSVWAAKIHKYERALRVATKLLQQVEEG